jgi:hypothetical protein
MKPPSTRRLVLIFTFIAALVLLLPSAGLFWLLGALRGAPLPPSATVSRARAVENSVPDDVPTGCGLRVRAASYTDYLHVEGDRPALSGLRFAPEGPSPIDSVTVKVRTLRGAQRRLVVRAREVVELHDLPCGEWTEAHIEGDDDSGAGAIPTAADLSEAAVLELSVRPLGTLEGVVVSTRGGAPVAGAVVFDDMVFFGRTRSGADGRFTWRGGVGPKARDALNPAASGPTRLKAMAVGFDPGVAPVPAALGHEAPAELRLELRPNHDIIVRCDFPDATGCPGEITCTGPVPQVRGAGRCFDEALVSTQVDPDALLCDCPGSGATIRGMGLAVAVPDGAREVLLEPPGGAGLSGQVLGVEPGQAQVVATRAPLALEDLPRGGLVQRHAQPDPEGRWVISGLIAGDWLVEVKTAPVRGRAEGSADGRLLRVAADGLRADEQRALGALQVGSSAALRLGCIDRLTGEAKAGGRVIARLDGASGALALPVFTECGATISGLNPGTWTAYPLPRLWEGEAVRLDGGALGELVLGGDDAAEPQQPLGLALSRGEDGLQIDAVEADGLGAVLGLQPGDRLIGAAIGPYPLPFDALLGEGAEAEAVLGLLELASEAEAEGLLGAMGLHLEVEPGPADSGEAFAATR